MTRVISHDDLSQTQNTNCPQSLPPPPPPLFQMKSSPLDDGQLPITKFFKFLPLPPRPRPVPSPPPPLPPLPQRLSRRLFLCTTSISSSEDLLEILVRRDHDGAGGNDLHESRDDADVQTGNAVDFDDALRRSEDRLGSGAVYDEVGFSEANLSPSLQDVERLRQESREKRRRGAGEKVYLQGSGRRRG